MESSHFKEYVIEHITKSSNYSNIEATLIMSLVTHFTEYYENYDEAILTVEISHNNFIRAYKRYPKNLWDGNTLYNNEHDLVTHFEDLISFNVGLTVGKRMKNKQSFQALHVRNSSKNVRNMALAIIDDLVSATAKLTA